MRTGIVPSGTSVAIVLLSVSSFVHAAPAAAQSMLEEVERLMRLGRTEEARVTLTDWWEGDRAEASRRDLQRGLWLRGRLTVDPVQAELDFQRLVVLYPSGDFTPDALLRLAQAAWVMGDEEGARRHVATLSRDYPSSEATVRAERWLSDPGPLPPPVERSARTAVDPDPSRQRAPREDPSVRAADEMEYSVQLGAFGEPDRAMALYDSVRDQGVAARVVRVRGSPFVHVRVGRFADRASAVRVMEELAARGIDAALVRDDRAEELVAPR